MADHSREDQANLNRAHWKRGQAFLSQFDGERQAQLESENEDALSNVLMVVRSHRPDSRRLMEEYVSPSRGFMLDVGSGEGRSRALMEETFPALTYEGVEIIGELAHATGAFHGSVEDMPGSSHYELAVANHVLEHSFNIESTLEALHRLLVPRGLLAHATPTVSPDYEVAHTCQLRVDEWLRLYLRKGFGVLHVHEQNIVCPEVQMVLMKLGG